MTTKGTLVRKYRVPSKPEGRKLLSAICSLLSDDDSFIDVSTHKVYLMLILFLLHAPPFADYSLT